MLSKFKIGHYTNIENGTGCTVIIPPEKNVTSAAVRGASPGTRELALLSPERKINNIHALVLTGGSAFGLNSAHGVMEELAAQKIGYQTNYGVVPIIPAAVIFDRNLGNPQAYPGAEHGRQALQSAIYNNEAEGNIGAGCGASVGKWRGMDFAMKSGIGLAHKHYGQIKVTALTVVNAAADILDEEGRLLAGAVDENGKFLAGRNPLARFDRPSVGMAENTVLTALFTNAMVTKQQAHYLAERAHHGIARRVDPSHTSYDGDVAFVIASIQEKADLDLVATMVVAAVEESILKGVRQAQSLFGLKSVREL